MTNGVWAVVVARAGRAPKSRLAAVLGTRDRRALALAMLADVLDACASAAFDGTVAVVDTPEAETVCAAHRAHVVREPAHGLGGMNPAVSAGLHAVAGQGAATAIVLPGDVPLVSQHDFEVLLAAAGRVSRAVVIGASRNGGGTNALLLRPPHVIAPSFGPPSVGRHTQAGQAAGAVTIVRRGLDLALDIDTPDDLAALRARPLTGSTGALLERAGVSAE